MAGSSQDQALRVVNEVLQGSRGARDRFERRSRFAANYPDRWRLGRLGTTVLADFRSGSYDVLNNIRYFMMAELVGIAPERYCIIYNPDSLFFTINLANMLNYLPRHKIVIYFTPPPFSYEEFNPVTRARIYLFLRRPALSEAEYLADFGPPQPTYVSPTFRFREPRRRQDV